MKSERKIALYDSGVGGLTVFKALKELLPDENYIYFGDLKNMPYGEKTVTELVEIADGIFKFFEKNEADIVVMACNTTSANVYDILKDRYNFKIYPIIQSCAEVIANMPFKKIGVFATVATVNSHAYSRELKKFNPDLEVFEIACPNWVKIVEEGLQNTPESIADIEKQVREMLLHKPDKIILGCTHYPYLKDILAKFAPEELFIDPSKYFAEFIAKEEAVNNPSTVRPFDPSTEKVRFFVSANPEQFKNAAKMFYELENLPETFKI